MEVAIEGIVDAVAVGADEFAAKLLLVRDGVEFAGGLDKFLIVHETALRGGELKGGPVGIVEGVFEAFVEMIAALGRADEERVALAVTESGAKHFGPSLGLHGGVFIEDDEIEAVAA